ncbi:hypothetical protein [Streptomyces xantholiticus]|uniref:hypothetical protein n=1 Tax=Streptomyces xantholiticus TaxID=68285 RepID=UPI0016760CBF|nr:hypothetical protein [Streptomyces xantholiticus]GGW74882.1 hypothetical protein GCM10010381_69460 [Streptomyces xantholiticus]
MRSFITSATSGPATAKAGRVAAGAALLLAVAGAVGGAGALVTAAEPPARAVAADDPWTVAPKDDPWTSAPASSLGDDPWTSAPASALDDPWT